MLVVSSDDSLCSIVRSFLGHAGFVVFVSSSPERASSTFLNRLRIDLWIIDVQATGIEGVCLASQVRENQPEIPIVLIADELSDEYRLWQALGGECRRMSKPVDLSKLLSTVHCALELGPRPRPRHSTAIAPTALQTPCSGLQIHRGSLSAALMSQNGNKPHN